MSPLRKILIAGFTSFLLIQFVQPARNKKGRVAQTDVTNTVPVPGEVLALLQTACYDCHSNNTRYPWYSYVQPIGWVLANHINTGKKNLNFSKFGSYSGRLQQSKLTSVESQVQDGLMPISSYTWMHSDARLNPAQRQLLVDWATAAKDQIRAKN